MSEIAIDWSEYNRKFFDISVKLKQRLSQKDAQIAMLKEALERLEKYVAHNGDCWVQNVSRKALAELNDFRKEQV